MLRPFWSYYGSRYQLVPHYPRPIYTRIVEPFAGAAAYSLHYPDLAVVLCDLDPIIAGIWDYLIHVGEDEIGRLPNIVEHVDELGPVPQEARWLVGFWLGRCRSAPRLTVGSWMVSESDERPGCFWGTAAKVRIASQLKHIRHWRVRCADYRDVSGEGPATWFIDPPFRGKAGRRYRKGSRSLDFAELGMWCRERQGQILVCEQSGADWLPFSGSAKGRGMQGEQDTLLWSNLPLPEQLSLDVVVKQTKELQA
jgi:hypothetical protein